MKDRKLLVNEPEAAVVQRIFEQFAKGNSVTTIVKALTAEGFRNKYGQTLDKGRIYKLLNNRVYIGDAVHKGTGYPGEHEAIIPKTRWIRSKRPSLKVRACAPTETGRRRRLS